MCGRALRAFLADEFGGGTVWGLLWFILMTGITGLAVDITNGFQARTMLQSTADSSALAAAIELPSNNNAVETAIAYAATNMPSDVYGNVLSATDVDVGSWDHENHIFNEGGLAPDAVRVTVYRAAANSNGVPVNFLRIIGLQEWNVAARAIAQRFIPDCLTDGLVARGLIDISSNNGFANEMCIHGQKGVAMQNHNVFAPGVNVSMPDLSSDLRTPNSGTSSNPGLTDALREQILDPRMVNHVDEIMADILDRKAYVLPGYIDATLPVIDKDENWNFDDVDQGRIYHIVCEANKNVGVPNDLALLKVAIVSDCNIGVGSSVFMADVIIASRSGGNPGGGSSGGGKGKGKSDSNVSGGGGAGVSNANISFASGGILGIPDGCAEGGGVQIFSNASVHFSSTMTLNGVQVVAAGDVDLGARDQGINGINVQAGGNITLTSNNMFGLCSGGAPSLFTVDYYRLVF